MPHKPGLFSAFEGLCWLSPYGEWQPLIWEQLHKNIPVLRSILGSKALGGSPICCWTAVWTSVYRRVMRLRVVLYFPLDLCSCRVSSDHSRCAVWFDRLPCFALCNCECFGAVFISAFFPCTHDLWGPCMRPVVFLVSKLKWHIQGLLNTYKSLCALLPFCYCKDFMWREEYRRAGGGLNCKSFSLFTNNIINLDLNQYFCCLENFAILQYLWGFILNHSR